MMNESICSFYDMLTELPKCYSWTRENNNIVAKKIRGTSKGTVFNPITAVASSRGLGTYMNNKKDTMKAGTQLGLPRNFTSTVYDATNARSNRGNTQVVRGRILSRLES